MTFSQFDKPNFLNFKIIKESVPWLWFRKKWMHNKKLLIITDGNQPGTWFFLWRISGSETWPPGPSCGPLVGDTRPPGSPAPGSSFSGWPSPATGRWPSCRRGGPGCACDRSGGKTKNKYSLLFYNYFIIILQKNVK